MTKIIFLHGPSSAGKSTLARVLQSRLEEPFWHVSIDHIRDAGVLPLERIRRGDFDWRTLRAAFFEGFHLSLGAYAQAGNQLIVEHIIETEAWLAQLVALLEPYDVFLVELRCPVEELERRERERGDRQVGDARRDFESLPRPPLLDLVLDSRVPAEENAERLMSSWRRRVGPSAFQRLAAARPENRAMTIGRP
ncbi:MAG: AAA family ATPase [Pseudomonadota bacterium]